MPFGSLRSLRVALLLLLPIFLTLANAQDEVVELEELECPSSAIALEWDYQSGINAVAAPTHYTSVKALISGGSSSNFDQDRNGGKLPFLSGVQKFLNYDFPGAVSIPYLYTVTKSSAQTNSTLIVHLVVLADTLENANETTQVFKAVQNCSKTSLEFNNVIYNEMNSHGSNSYVSYQNVTVLDVQLLTHALPNSGVVFPLIIFSGLYGALLVLYLALKEGTNLELFHVKDVLYAPITVRRPET
jgi:hypothetical protein